MSLPVNRCYGLQFYADRGGVQAHFAVFSDAVSVLMVGFNKPHHVVNGDAEFQYSTRGCFTSLNAG